MTVRWLSKSWGKVNGKGQAQVTQDGPRGKVIVCTGERMEGLVLKLYKPLGIKTTNYEPVHAKGLSNEFYCYSNYEGDAWKYKTDKEKAEDAQRREDAGKN